MCVCVQLAAVVFAFLCSAYLVAFTGVPLVLSVIASPDKDREAIESALKHGCVLDEAELRAGGRDYVSWSVKEAAAVEAMSPKSAGSNTRR